jgi:Uma2 family endonuclease
MTWADVCADKSLQDLPYKIELNRFGRIEMSPHRKEHSAYQGEIIRLLSRLMKGGRAFPECAVETSDGVRVPDVVWVSNERWASMSDAPACSVAPELCIEVLSWTNNALDIEDKGKLYHTAGAKEFWVCSEDGSLRFYDQHGPMKKSKLCPKFPAQVRL